MSAGRWYRVTLDGSCTPAKTNLSKLIESVLGGEEVVIAQRQHACGQARPDPPQDVQIGLLEKDLDGRVERVWQNKAGSTPQAAEHDTEHIR